jgi:AraC-like DNA-binding protein
LETLLKYSDRFYKRQFINRQEASSILLDKFKAELRCFYTENQISGIPNIEAIANKLSVSQRYLSDTLKTETGKSAKEHINLFIVAKAKDMLIGTSESISQIAYDLGFEYPQHFSKMFKKQTGQSPKEYRHHLN